MTILTSIILVAATVLVVTFIAYYMQRGVKTLKEFKADFDNNGEVQELADLAKELYNKDLRPTVAKKAPKAKKSEFPIDQPVKKVKQVEVTSEDITPQVIEKAVEIAKVLPEQATLNVEAIVETIKPKKKRKYHSKAPKGKA